jgi:hypothetical protein
VGEFRDWLECVPATEVVLVAGNHDQSIQAWGVPDGLRCHYLEDSGAELFGLKLWGTPARRVDTEITMANRTDNRTSAPRP